MSHGSRVDSFDESNAYLVSGALEVVVSAGVADAGCSYESGSTLKTKSRRFHIAKARTARTTNPLNTNEKLTSL